MIEVAAGKERYFRWYRAICARGQVRALDSGFERHHIAPRSLGGTNDASNLTRLTYREHFLAHWLLTKFTEGSALRKMRYALNMMAKPGGSRKRLVSGWQFEVARAANASARTGSVLSEEHRARISAGNAGKTLSERHRQKLRAAKLGSSHSAETRARIGAASRGQKRGPRSEETKARIRAAKLGTTHSETTRAKIGEAARGRRLTAEHRAKIGAAGTGKKRSAETCARISEAKTGKRRAPHTAEHKARMSEKIRAVWAARKANNELASHAVA